MKTHQLKQIKRRIEQICGGYLQPIINSYVHETIINSPAIKHIGYKQRERDLWPLLISSKKTHLLKHET